MQGISYIDEYSNDDIININGEYYNSFEKIKTVSTIIICVPTPLDSKNVPDLLPLKSALSDLAPFYKRTVGLSGEYNLSWLH